MKNFRNQTPNLSRTAKAKGYPYQGRAILLGVDPIERLIERREKRKLPPPALRRMAREEAGLTQGEVAAALGVSRPALSRWESGLRTPRGPNGDKYAALLRRLVAGP